MAKNFSENSESEPYVIHLGKFLSVQKSQKDVSGGGNIKLRYRRGGKYYKEWYCYATACDSGSNELLSGTCLYQFSEKRKLVKIIAGRVDGKGKTTVYNPIGASASINSMPKGKGCSVSSELEALVGLKW